MNRCRVPTIAAAAVLLVAAQGPQVDWPKPPPPWLAPPAQKQAFPDVRPPDPGTAGYAVAIASGWAACARYSAIHQVDPRYGTPAGIAMTAVDGCPNSQATLNRIVSEWRTKGWPLKGAVALHERMRYELMRSVSQEIARARGALSTGESRPADWQAVADR